MIRHFSHSMKPFSRLATAGMNTCVCALPGLLSAYSRLIVGLFSARLFAFRTVYYVAHPSDPRGRLRPESRASLIQGYSASFDFIHHRAPRPCPPESIIPSRLSNIKSSLSVDDAIGSEN